MTTYKTISSYQLTDRTTGKITTHTGEWIMELDDLDATAAATNAIGAVRVAAGKRAKVTGLTLTVTAE